MDRQPLIRAMATHEGRHVGVFELRWPVNTSRRPHRVTRPTKLRVGEELPVGILDLFKILGMPPQQHIPIGAHAGKIVNASDDNSAIMALDQEPNELFRDLRPIRRKHSPSDTEH